MRAAESDLVFSATDLSNYLACPHLSLLDRSTALGGPKPLPFDDPSAEVLRQRGLEHEQHVLEGLGSEVVEIEQGAHEIDATIQAMHSGAHIIYQGALRSERWFGRPDFLVKVDKPSRLGGHSYEVLDAKLARAAKGGALLQLLVYADLLENAQGVLPEEAGQFSLADAVAVAPAADSLVLLGDPMQLDQPMQGVHPPGADVSALGHLLDDEPTMPPEQGLFLEKTYHLHPNICAKGYRTRTASGPRGCTVSFISSRSNPRWIIMSISRMRS